jgi:hypothetical protein
MFKHSKILIFFFIIIVFNLLVFLFLNNSSNNQENNYSFEEKELIVSMPQELEIMAYRESSFDFSIKNEKENDLDNLNITLEGAPGKINPNNINIKSNESKNFKLTFDSLKPGEYDVFLKIQADPDTYVNKSVSLKSKIVVGLDGYHDRSPGFPRNYWERENSDEWYFVEFLHENDIETKVINSSFSPEVLKKVNIIIIKSPKKIFLSDERETIKNFLNEGNGLLLVSSIAMPQVRSFTEDLFDWLGLRVELAKFESDSYVRYFESNFGWTNEIKKHSITEGINEIWHNRSYILDTQEPVFSLVEKKSFTIYAIQNYSQGKIGIIVSPHDLVGIKRDQITNLSSSNRNQLNLNLIKWLARPEIYEEMG